jgi:spore coat polysaccharide biosynthesis protein SpsF
LKALLIVQARISSTRLKDKMLLDLHGYPIFEWVYRRVSMSKLATEVVFAIPENKSDDIFANSLKNIGVKVLRGKEYDLVDRFYQVARLFKAETIVRVCADNPLVCASEIDRLIEFFDENSCDYAYNNIPKNNSYPDGLGAEICSMKVLEEIHNKSFLKEHREHVFNYLWSNFERFNIKTFEPPLSLAYPSLKFDVDTIYDYNNLLEKPYKIDMTAKEIVNLSLKLN